MDLTTTKNWDMNSFGYLYVISPVWSKFVPNVERTGQNAAGMIELRIEF
jgi:hypothetical protein